MWKITFTVTYDNIIYICIILKLHLIVDIKELYFAKNTARKNMFEWFIKRQMTS